VTVTLSAAWKKPAERWQEAIERYVEYRQLPTWRAKAVENDGKTESSGSDKPEKTAKLKKELSRAIDFVAACRGVLASNCDIQVEDIKSVKKELTGVNVSREQKKLSKDNLTHLRNAYLYNRDSYTCQYCRRTAWGVYAEDTGSESRRVLRLEADHRVSRQLTKEPEENFDLDNLVAACRSCNAIKLSFREERFRLELKSLATAVLRNSDT